MQIAVFPVALDVLQLKSQPGPTNGFSLGPRPPRHEIEYEKVNLYIRERKENEQLLERKEKFPSKIFVGIILILKKQTLYLGVSLED